MFGTPELEEFRMSRKLRGANSPPKRHRPQTARPRFEGGTRVHIPMAYRNIWCVSMSFCRKHHKRVPQELGGVAAPSIKCCEATFERRRRGGSLLEPPRPRLQRNGNIFLMARPPLLT